MQSVEKYPFPGTSICRNISSRLIMAGFAPYLIVCLVGISPPLEARAQVVTGVVRDELTELPVYQAVVTIVNQESRDAFQGETDIAGRFEVQATGTGLYMIYVSRLGYEHIGGGPFEWTERDTVSIDLFIARDPVVLEAVTVEADRTHKYLEVEGFYNRKRMGWGQFVMREDIEKRVPVQVSDIFSGLKATAVMRRDGRQEIYSARSRGCLMTIIIDGNVAIRSSMAIGRGGRMRGVAGMEDLSIDGLLSVDAIEAIEVYSGSKGIPQQWQRDSPCGAVLIWTRR